MQTVIDHVISKFSIKQPMSDAQSQAVRDEAAQFAAQLLANYNNYLARRSLRSD